MKQELQKAGQAYWDNLYAGTDMMNPQTTIDTFVAGGVWVAEKIMEKVEEILSKSMDTTGISELISILLAVEHDFPKLKESKDERIRKYLIEELKAAKSVGELKFAIPQPTREECISYLERQKEQKVSHLHPEDYPMTPGECIKPAWSEDERIRKEIIAFIEWSLERGSITTEQRIASQSWFAYLEKQEQKPAEKQDYSGLTDFERALHRGFLCAGVENVPVTIIKETAQDCLAHIKPVELKYWDKEMVRSIISILERDNCFKVVDEKPMRIFAHEQEINYLRNLQEYLYPNPHWKPSEEEMRTLLDAINPYRLLGDGSREILKSLYEQLKKL